MTEWFGLRGTFQGHLVQTPCKNLQANEVWITHASKSAQSSGRYICFCDSALNACKAVRNKEKAYNICIMVVYAIMARVSGKIPSKCTNLVDTSNCPFWPQELTSLI